MDWDDLLKFIIPTLLVIALLQAFTDKGCSLTINDKVYSVKFGDTKSQNATP